jgi:outer membrane protein assembly factor BamC
LHLAAPAVLAVLAALAGCTWTSGPSGSSVDYRSGATKTQGLDVPPDLTQLARDGRYRAPAGGVVSAAGAAQQPAAAAATGSALPAVTPAAASAIRVEREGNQRWLVVPQQSPEQLFPTVRAFWIDSGFSLAMENPQAGVMETDWAEDRSRIPSNLIRNTIGRLFDGLYDSGLRDRFRTRIERSPDGGSEIYISHRGMEEVLTGMDRDNTAWTPRPSDPELEAEFLTLLMVRMGSSEEVARTAVAQVPDQPARARALSGQPAAALEMDESFSRAWRRVGLALDRTGFTVEDRDRAAGLYFVRYADPAKAPTGEQGFFSRIFGGKSEEGAAALRYRIAVVGESEERTVVSVLDAAGAPEPGPTGQRIIGLLIDELR